VAVKFRYQETTSEDWEAFMCAIGTWYLECVIQLDCYSYS
jgi:hypothetical protein